MITETEVQMTLAVAEAIVHRREVTWIAYSTGEKVERAA